GCKPEERAKTLVNIGLAQQRLDNPEKAREAYGQALDLARQADDRKTQSRVLANLGYLELSLGHPGTALERCRDALLLAAGDGEAESAARNAMGAAYLELGDLEAARTELQRAAAISRERGDDIHEANSLLNLARVARRRG